MSEFYSPTIDEAPDAEIDPPSFVKFPASAPPTSLRNVIDELQLIEHGEGGFFKETDRSPFTMAVAESDDHVPMNSQAVGPNISVTSEMGTVTRRHYSTLIYYLLTPSSPIGRMHKNKNRIIHILQKGKGQYVLIYPDGRVKSFKVGFNHSQGEVSHWVVPGGVYKASFVQPNEEFSNGLLISEVVVPGFEYIDHNFMSGLEELQKLVGEDRAEQLKFLI
ncbi:hypothetical protein ZYGR_0H04710 [Zygosaccharomyces rouxii]|uniref:ZYRO0B14850p n=2 Tax=Zygosaccharomyces rouxii TaxID=4956 RepID=C5DS91_ZYGRC|nr:uncharacterized protein ZYRO0B14850g [Zygosaccharomyces rouxii]KAH9199819.1 RmlC-like cupin domain-containing protein [Zygosaccharomyces rouxii]GAV47625.1 hypothetical protein ZYGR_0H04710 [Zygosaccharomyces rouxii]CAR26652.1 ZYRO0B14850p [Zygosaccharomyces rouxii]